MPWGRLDDQANGNAKLLALSDSAYRMWAAGLIYCQANLTDGFIPTSAISTFGVRARDKRKVAAELRRVLIPGKGPLWHRAKGGFAVHDYLDWNDAKAKILKDRQGAKDRLTRFRKRLRNGARNNVRNAFRTANEHLSTTTTTGVSKEQKHPTGRGRVFLGKRLKVSHKQHEVVCDELGALAGHVDLLALYARWDAHLEASGEEFDTLAFIKHHAADAAKALRRGGPLYADDPERDARLATAAEERSRREVAATERASAVYQALSADERRLLAAQIQDELSRQFKLVKFSEADIERGVIQEIQRGLGGRTLEAETQAVRDRVLAERAVS